MIETLYNPINLYLLPLVVGLIIFTIIFIIKR